MTDPQLPWSIANFTESAELLSIMACKSTNQTCWRGDIKVNIVHNLKEANTSQSYLHSWTINDQKNLKKLIFCHIKLSVVHNTNSIITTVILGLNLNYVGKVTMVLHSPLISWYFLNSLSWQSWQWQPDNLWQAIKAWKKNSETKQFIACLTPNQL